MEAVHPSPDSAVPSSATRKMSPRASASYPYFDLHDSLAVAQSIHERAGGSCDPDQLAVFLGYKSTKSGTFQTRLSAAKQFGFVRTEGGSIAVTERAMKILSPVLPEDAVTARVDAFLNIDLFSKVFDRFKGTTIPPRVGVKNLFSQAFGLAPDRLDPAVRVMFDSAKQAGMFPDAEENRLVRPAAKSPGSASAPTSGQMSPATSISSAQTDVSRAGSGHGGPGGGDGPAGIHTAIIGLLRELPAAGEPWARRSKERFVKAFLATLDFVYPDDEEGGGANVQAAR